MGIGLDTLLRVGGSRRARWTAGVVTAAVVLAGSASAYALTRPPRPPAPAASARVDRGDVTLAVAAIGKLRPAQTRSLGFRAAGTVTAVNVRAGDDVQAGQVLALIGDADAQAQVAAAQQAVTQAESALAAAQASPTATPGGTCLAAAGGAAVAVLPVRWQAASGATVPGVAATPSPSSPAPAPSRSASPSPSPHPSSPSQPRPSQSRQPVRSGQPTPAAGSRTCAGGVATSPRTGPAGSTGTDPVLRAQQQVTSAKLALANAQDALAGTRIAAPIAGKVLSVAGAVGSAVRASGTFLTLADVAGMEVAASFPEADAVRLTLGLGATVTLADRPGVNLAAKVTQLDPVGTTNGTMVTYGAVLSFDQAPAGALVGQTANIRVTVQSVSNALRVPTTAVHGITGATGTVRCRTAGGVQSRQVAIGVRGDQYTEITSGLVAGDEVVVNW